MKQITLRGIPDEVARVARREAKRKRLSLNRSFVLLLEKAAGVKGKERKETHYHDLDHLAGVWTKEEAEDFSKGLESQRRIDEDSWKKQSNGRHVGICCLLERKP